MKIEMGQAARGIASIVEEMSGVDLRTCYQCKKCTSGCPVSGLTESSPSEMIRRLLLGAGDEILDSDIIWTCASCETCFARCPMEIDTASVINALRTLALERGAAAPEGNVPLFNSAFLKTVKMFGRNYDLAMIAAYKFGTASFMKDTDKFPAMLKKGKISLLPPRGADKKRVKRIFEKVRKNRGE